MRDIRSTIADHGVPKSEQCRMCRATANYMTEGAIRVRRGSPAERRDGPFRPRRYYQCEQCGHIQCAAGDLPDNADERERYDEHNNDLGDPRYREYLSAFIDTAVTPHRPTPARILDYGSGPEPALATLLTERGYTVEIYDPFYAPDTAPLEAEARYDGITAVEVVEHFHDPRRYLDRIVSLIRPSGFLAIRTGVYTGDPQGFTEWWYRRDPTHVSFWTEQTIPWVQDAFGLELVERTPGEILVFRLR